MDLEQPVASPAELAELRASYLLRKDVTFLNHGSFGACPRPVFERYQAWQREVEAEPVDFLGRRVSGLLAEARARLAAFVGTEANNLVFVPNTTFGLNVVARSLGLQPGDEVLSTNHEYGAIERTWRFNGAKTGARYISQPIPLPVEEDRQAVVDQLWEGVTARTRVIAISHISSPTAIIFPVAEICARARAAGIITVIDGAHAPGQVDLALDDWGPDFYVGNCHKWLSAPKGTAFLYANPDRQAILEPLVISWGWESMHPGPSRFIDYFEWVGTQDPSAYLSVPAAVEFQEQHNWPRVRAACHQLLNQARHRIGELTGLPPITPDTAEWWSQMCSIPLPDALVDRLGGRLWEQWKIEVPITSWNGQRFVRVSIQAYNTEQDIERLVQALTELL
jgi:isopenicillin-N epimerase